MLGSIKGLAVTLGSMMRRPVTAQYPDPNLRLPIDERFMGFPALLWDESNAEPYCTGCMVCVRECPTQCMSAEMTDNPRFEAGESTRKKIIESFEINLGRCILCGICVDVCNFDAIEMSHEHELSNVERDANRADLGALLDLGKTWQADTGWTPAKAKNVGDPEARKLRQAREKAVVAPLELVVKGPSTGSGRTDSKPVRGEPVEPRAAKPAADSAETASS